MEVNTADALLYQALSAFQLAAKLNICTLMSMKLAAMILAKVAFLKAW